MDERTGGKIRDLLQPPHPRPDTSLVLTNAIYFKGDWSSPFSKGATKDEAFTLAAGERVVVPMMHRAGRLDHHDGGDFQALELAYAGNELSMVVLLPKRPDDLAAVERSLTVERLSGWLGKLGPRRVDVALPRFRVESAFELQEILSEMGMPLAFTGSADFSGIDFLLRHDRSGSILFVGRVANPKG